MSSRAANKRKNHNSAALKRWIVVLIRFLLSPIVLLADSFRKKGILDRTWLFSFFLFNTVLMSLAGIGILVTEDPLVKTMKMMTTVTENHEILAGDLQPIIRLINKYALENNVDPNLVFAIIKAESNFNPTAVSRKGAKGIMQLMPEVWLEYRSSPLCSGNHRNNIICHYGECIFTPEANIKAGVKYFRDLLNRYQGRVDLALEAYNAGISNVKPGAGPRFRETKGYINKIIGYWQGLRQDAITRQLDLSLYLQRGLKYLFGLSFLCWIILFWWANRKLFSK